MVKLREENKHFNPLPPHGGRPVDSGGAWDSVAISIHSLRMEGDLVKSGTMSPLQYFNPLPPHGGRPRCGALKVPPLWNFNPLPPHGGRLFLLLLKQYL